jgi:diguanylate cyclase (GGDEF)-like protein
VTNWRFRLPDGNLSRVRLAALVYAGVSSFSQLGQLGNPLRSAAYLPFAVLCIVLCFGILANAYRRAAVSWWTAVPVPALVALGAAGLKDPVAAIGLALAALIVLALYGSTRLYCVRVVGAMISLPAAVAVSPMSAGREIYWNSPTVIALMPQIILMGVLTRGIYLSLLRQERASARESVLARAGHAMLGVTDVARVRETGQHAAAELVALNPGIAMLVLSARSGRLRMVSVAGGPADLDGRALGNPAVPDPAELTLLLPDFHDWHIDSLGTDPATADRFIAVGAHRRVPPDVLDAFRTLSHQVMLAESNCQAVAELDHHAHHDHLTELPTRAKFLRALDHALTDDAAGVVALLNVDLDDFKQVNDGYGHASGDELLVTVAGRLTRACAGRGMAARFGGDEFAVLLTGLTGADEADHLAERLIADLAAPIPLTTATVTVGASIGIAVAEPGVTVAELSRRADVAMYSAKTAGKNCIESFRPGQSADALFGQWRRTGDQQSAA